MFRSPKAGDWAADDDDDVEIAPIHMPTPAASLASPPPAASAKKPSQADRNATSSRRQETSSSNDSSEPPTRNRWGRTPDEAQSGRRNYDNSSSSSGNGREYNRSGSGSGYDRDSRRDGGYERRDSSNYSGGGGYGRDGGFERRDGGDRYGGNSSGSGRYGGRDDRYGARDSGYNRRQQQQHVELPVEQGVVVSIMESFGFVSCVNREGDMFFHITEAPMDVQVQDEVEFRVKFNQRSNKEIACQLVLLPKGTIVMEDVRQCLMVYLYGILSIYRVCS